MKPYKISLILVLNIVLFMTLFAGTLKATNDVKYINTKRKTIAVICSSSLLFKGEKPEDSGVVDNMQQQQCSRVILGLVKNSDFDVVDRENLDNLLKEHHLAADGIVDSRYATKIGQISGADVILFCKFRFNVLDAPARIKTFVRRGQDVRLGRLVRHHKRGAVCVGAVDPVAGRHAQNGCAAAA